MTASEEKTCPRCAETVKAAAIICKHCGYEFDTSLRSEPKPGAKKPNPAALGCVSLIGLAVMLFVVGGIGSKTASNIALQGSGSTSPSPPPLGVSAVDLARAYEENEQAAQTKYGGRPLKVSGTIARIELDITNDPMVSLKGGDEFREVTLHFDKSAADKTGRLRKGQRFTATCGAVAEVLSLPQLSDCRIE